MRVVRVNAAAVIDRDHQAVSAFPRSRLHHAIGRGADRSSRRSGDIDAGVKRSFTGEWVHSPAEGARQPAGHRPDARPRARRLNPARAVAVQFHRIGAAQEVVLFHTFRETRRQFTFAGNIRRSFQLLLNAVGDRNFLSVDFQAGQLLIGLVHHFLEVLVTRA